MSLDCPSILFLNSDNAIFLDGSNMVSLSCTAFVEDCNGILFLNDDVAQFLNDDFLQSIVCDIIFLPTGGVADSCFSFGLGKGLGS